MEIENTGFSLKEIKAAGRTIAQLRFNKIFVDKRRLTCKDAYVEQLKKLELKAIPKTAKKAPKEKKAKAPKAEKAAAAKTVVASKVAKLEDLEGIDEKTVQKLKDLGIDSPAKLASEDVKELAKLTKLTQKQLNAWRDQITG